MRRLSTLLALALGLLAAPSAHVAPPPAGTVIEAQAEASYLNAGLGTRETVRSNVVRAIVLPVPGIEATGGTTLRRPRSGQGFHAFRARNVGNVALRLDPPVIELPDDDFDLVGTLYSDADGDGALGPDDPLADALSLTLQPGEEAAFIYAFRLPASVTPEQIARTRFIAQGSTLDGQAVEDAAEATVIVEPGGVSLEKSGRLDADGARIAYRIVLLNDGDGELLPSATADGRTVTLDGAPVTAIVVRDAIPLGATFSAATGAGGFAPAYHRRGDPAQSYLTDAPPAAEVDAVAWLSEAPLPRGHSVDLGLALDVSAVRGDLRISNTARVFPEGEEIASNAVVTLIEGPDAAIGFRDPASDTPLDAAPFDANVLVRLAASACNLTGGIDVARIELRGLGTGDLETLEARETGPNTGIFRTAPIALREGEAVPGNARLEARGGHDVIATATCTERPISAALTVRPGGVVFDALTNAPVRAALVRLVPEGGGGPVAEASTDAAGYYDLGTIAPGRYRLEVETAGSFAFPSARRDFPGFGRRVSAARSFGGTFEVTGVVLPATDLPVDPGADLPLELTKQAGRDRVRRGEAVIYEVEGRNALAQALLGATVEDRLPPGFAYVEGSARLEGERLDGEVAQDGRDLSFPLGTLEPSAGFRLTYAARVLPSAGQGRRVNLARLEGAQAGTGRLFNSLPARAVVRVDDTGGPLTDEAVVLGRVFLDRDGDGMQSGPDEPGVPGVKLVTSGGLLVVTDREGRFSLFGLRPVTQVLGVVGATLPAGAKPLIQQADDALRPGSRLLDLRRGELRQETFPLTWSEAAAADVEARKAGFARLPAPALDLPLPFDARTRLTTRDEAAVGTTTEIEGSATTTGTPSAPKGHAETTQRPAQAIESAIAGLDPQLGFVGLADGAVMTHPALDVRVKSPAEASVRLEVNGEPLGEDRIGGRAIDRDAGVQLHDFVAVRLAPGPNRLAIVAADPFGNERAREEVTVHAPGAPAALALAAPREAPADPRRAVPVVLRVLDAQGHPTHAPVEVTLSAERGTWDVRDIRDTQPGIQTLIEGGTTVLRLIPPDLVGGTIVRAHASFGAASAEIGFTPDLDGRVLAGVVEGGLRIGGGSIEGLLDTGDLSAFEQTREGVSGRLYLKGRIRGDALLTLRYESDRPDDERLFRDIRADAFYPVYGDRAERGFDAQSDSSLYVKVERGRSFALWGDLAVEPQARAIRLGAWRRSLTGGRLHLERGPVTLDVFAAETEGASRVIEIDGRGVSGPYDLDLRGYVEGSEVVEILVRDRERPGVILSATPQRRFSDYSLDFFGDALVFARPVPRLDDALNPVSIRITYETERGEEGLIYGAEIRVEPVEGAALGYREVRAEDGDGREVRAAYAEADLGTLGAAELEVAQTDSASGEGWGARVAYALDAGATALRAEAAATGQGFDVPGAAVSPGREEARVLLKHVVTERLAFGAEALWSRDRETGERRAGAELAATYGLRSDLDVTGGLRGVVNDRGAGEDTLSVVAGVRWRPAPLPGASLRAEYEQDVLDGAHWRALLGADYQWHPGLRFYGLAELSTSDAGAFGIGASATERFTTRIGAEYRVTEAITGVTEYREAGRGLSDGGFANAFRGTWRVGERTSLRAAFEHVEPVTDDDERETSAALGMAWEDDALGVVLRADLEGARDGEGHEVHANWATSVALRRDLSLLAQNRFAWDDRGEGRLRDRARVGLAWRPEHHSAVAVLGLAEIEHDDEGARAETALRWSLAGTWAPTGDVRLSARYAGERFALEGEGLDEAGIVHVLRAGGELDVLGDRAALGAFGALIADGEGNLAGGGGIEAKLAVAPNAQVAIGWEHYEIEEAKLRSLARSGLHLRLRLKLDEGAFASFDRAGITVPGEPGAVAPGAVAPRTTQERDDR